MGWFKHHQVIDTYCSICSFFPRFYLGRKLRKVGCTVLAEAAIMTGLRQLLPHLLASFQSAHGPGRTESGGSQFRNLGDLKPLTFKKPPDPWEGHFFSPYKKGHLNDPKKVTAWITRWFFAGIVKLKCSLKTGPWRSLREVLRWRCKNSQRYLEFFFGDVSMFWFRRKIFGTQQFG